MTSNPAAPSPTAAPALSGVRDLHPTRPGGGKLRVAVLFGGRSSEHAVSCVSAAGVLSALDRSLFDVVPIGITTCGAWLPLPDSAGTWAAPAAALSAAAAASASAGVALGAVLPSSLLGAAVTATASPAALADPAGLTGRGAPIDVVLPMLHGPFGEDGTVQGLLEMLDLPYVGCGVLASAAGMHKHLAKQLFRAAGLRVADSVTLHLQPADPDRADLDRTDVRSQLDAVAGSIEQLGLPLFVKPSRAGSSHGVSRVTDPSQLAQAVLRAAELDRCVLIEAAVRGREIECGVLQLRDGTVTYGAVAEIRLAAGAEFYDFDAKYAEQATELIVPAPLSSTELEHVRTAAGTAFRALGCAGLARVDFFLTDTGLILNEINTMPGFTPTSLFPRMWAARDVDYARLLEHLIVVAVQRSGRPAVVHS